MPQPLAYHLTWHTYGSWLQGHERGWVNRKESGIRQPQSDLEIANQDRLKSLTVYLTEDQRNCVHTTIYQVCKFREWTILAVNCQPTHVHAVIASEEIPEKVMNQLKSWASRRLNEKGRREYPWWSRHGSTKWINDQRYLEEVLNYVLNRQSHGRSILCEGGEEMENSRDTSLYQPRL